MTAKTDTIVESNNQNTYQNLRLGVAYIGLVVAIVLCGTGRGLLGSLIGILFFEPIIHQLPLKPKHTLLLEHTWIVAVVIALVSLMMFQ